MHRVSWVLLFAAGGFEVVWALALKRSDGFAHLGPTVVFVIALALSMVLLAFAMRDLPLGTAYAVWTGTGAVGAALAGIALLGESATPGRLLAIAMVAGGIVWLALGESGQARA